MSASGLWPTRPSDQDRRRGSRPSGSHGATGPGHSECGFVPSRQMATLHVAARVSAGWREVLPTCHTARHRAATFFRLRMHFSMPFSSVAILAQASAALQEQQQQQQPQQRQFPALRLGRVPSSGAARSCWSRCRGTSSGVLLDTTCTSGPARSSRQKEKQKKRGTLRSY